MSDWCSICQTSVNSIIAHHVDEHGGWEAADGYTGPTGDDRDDDDDDD